MSCSFLYHGRCENKKVFAGFFQKAAGVSGAKPTSRDRNRGIPPERAEQARSGIMRSETQEGEPEISPVDCFGPGEPSSGVPPARRRRHLAYKSPPSTKKSPQGDFFNNPLFLYLPVVGVGAVLS